MRAVPGALRTVTLDLVECWEDAQRFITWLGERRPVMGFDTETTGLRWTFDTLRLAQFGDARSGWVIPPAWLGLAKEALTRYDGPLVAHNLMFDLHFLANEGIDMPRHRLHDTSVMSHNLDPRRPRALKKLASALIDPHADLGQQALAEGMSKNKWTWATVPVEFGAYWMYSALDPVITARLWEGWQSDIAARQAVYDLDIAAELVCYDVERRGFRVDLDYAQRGRDSLRTYAEQMREWIQSEYGIKPTNNKVSEVLVREGVELTERTPSGLWKMDEAVLSSVSDHPLAGAVLEVRKAEKTAKAYFEAILNNVVGDRVHASINTLGARTGRMSVSRPPLQQIPADSSLVRDCFIPSDGNSLVSVDFDQIELRLLAHFAQEQAMIDAIHGGVDLHTMAARLIFHTETPTKPQRSLAKNGTFALIYGAGHEKFAGMQKISVAEATQFFGQYATAFPGISGFIEQVKSVGEARLAREGVGYVTTPLGRWNPIKPKIEGSYVLVNYLIQSTAADLFKSKMVAVDAAGYGEFIRMPVHDELILDVPSDIAPDVLREVSEVMSDLDSWSVPISASGSIVNRWGDEYAACKRGLPCSRTFCNHEEVAA